MKLRQKIVGYKSAGIGLTVGLMTGVMLLVTGCRHSQSEEETVEDRVIEKLDAREDTAEAEVSEQPTEEVTAVAETERDVETISAEKDYLEYMSDDELKDLAIEALTAAGKDTSLVTGKLVTLGVTFVLPEGFYQAEDNKGMYITDRYPIDASNIIDAELPVDYTLQLMDESYFADLLEGMFASLYDEEINVELKRFDQIKIDGVPSFKIKAEYMIGDQTIYHDMIVINGTKTYVMIYTQTSDYDRSEIFDESIASIHVKKR